MRKGHASLVDIALKHALEVRQHRRRCLNPSLTHLFVTFHTQVACFTGSSEAYNHESCYPIGAWERGALHASVCSCVTKPLPGSARREPFPRPCFAMPTMDATMNQVLAAWQDSVDELRDNVGAELAQERVVEDLGHVFNLSFHDLRSQIVDLVCDVPPTIGAAAQEFMGELDYSLQEAQKYLRVELERAIGSGVALQDTRRGLPRHLCPTLPATDHAARRPRLGRHRGGARRRGRRAQRRPAHPAAMTRVL